MNSKTLRRRSQLFNRRHRGALSGSVESDSAGIVDDVPEYYDDVLEDDSDNDGDDDDSYDAIEPIPDIVDDIEKEINPSRVEQEAEEGMALLDEGIEAMFNLSRLRQELNFPLSGRKANVATILRVNPAIETMVPMAAKFNRKQLSVAIEQASHKILAVAIGVLVALIVKVIIGTISKLSKKRREDKLGITDSEFKFIRRAMHSTDKVDVRKSLKVLKALCPKFTSQYVASGKAFPILKDVAYAIYDEYVWPNTDNYTAVSFANMSDFEKIAKYAKAISDNIKSFHEDIARYAGELEKAVKSKHFDASLGSYLSGDKHKALIESFQGYFDEAKALSSKARPDKISFDTYMTGAERFVALQTNFNNDNLINARKPMEATAAKLQECEHAMKNLGDDTVNLNIAQKQVAELKKFIGYSVQTFTAINKQHVAHNLLMLNMRQLNLALAG